MKRRNLGVRLSMGLLLSAIAAPAAWAEHRFEASRLFRVEAHCKATRALRKKSEAVPLRPGAELIAYGLNKRDNATHAKIRLNWKFAWAPLSCGRIVAGGPENAAECKPFFDDKDDRALLLTGEGDITPPPPKISKFGWEVAQLCGAPGSPVARADFEALLRRHPDLLNRVRRFSDGRVSPGDKTTADDAAFLTKLSGFWFGAKGFEHVFCGEPSPAGAKREKIGGLHFHGRYLQLQQKKQACRIANHPENELEPGAVYTMGVSMRNASGGVSRFAVKGYGLTLSAEDLLKIGVRANAARAAEPKRGACRLTIKDDGRAFSAVFVWRPAGLRTFYPDATPDETMAECAAIDLGAAP